MKFVYLSGCVLLGCAGLVLAFGTGCTTSRSAAGNPEQRLQALFQKADSNGDGRVSRDEFTALMLEEAFDWMDAQRNGRISEAEFLAAGGTRAQFRSLDRGGKGYFTVEDAKANAGARRMMALPFDGADQSGDGFITWDEFQAYRARAAAYTN